MNISTKICKKGGSKLSVYEALQLMLGFGSFLVAIIGLVVAVINMNNKK